MSKPYRPWRPDQDYLLPPSPREWLPDGHLVYFLLDVVAELDLSAIEAVYQAKDPRGTVPYDPRLMVALWLYGLSQGVYSSRRLERATYEDVGFRVLAGEAHPDHTRLSEFRRVHHAALAELFTQVLRLCQQAGLVKLGQVALDGTKLAANASKHKAMSYDRLSKSEAELQAEVKALLARAESSDQADDERLGVGVGDDDVPAELARREARLERIREAKAALEAEARAAREAEESDALEPPEAERPLPSHQVPHDRAGRPTDKAQRNFTDRDSRIMKRDKTFLQGYNGQAAVDSAHQIIVAHGLTNQSPDQQHLVPLMQRVERELGERPECLLADNGYWSADNATWLAEAGIDGYLATGREGKATDLAVATTPAGEAKAAMRAKLARPEGKAVYARRKAIVEPVFEQLREARGFKRLARRGLDQARSEWALLCTVHNLLKLFRVVTG